MDGSDEDASSSSEDKLKEENNEEDFEEDLEQQHFLEPQVRMVPIIFRKKEGKIRFVKLIYTCFSQNKFH